MNKIIGLSNFVKCLRVIALCHEFLEEAVRAVRLDPNVER